MTSEVTVEHTLVELGDLPNPIKMQDIAAALTHLSKIVYNDNVKVGWWKDSVSGRDLVPGFNAADNIRNTGLVLALIHSEVSEALEGFRKDLMDDHLPHRKMAEVELADTIIRIMDLAGAYEMDIGAALIEKLEYNKHRADHKIENRQAAGGKAF